MRWGGDAACSWDGLADSIRGGLHLGLSGFSFWSHDVPGFHGVPDFVSGWPADVLYMRWTQVGVFSSHLRYHGTLPRELYEYPAVVDIVRNRVRLTLFTRFSYAPPLSCQNLLDSRCDREYNGMDKVTICAPNFWVVFGLESGGPTCWGASRSGETGIFRSQPVS